MAKKVVIQKVQGEQGPYDEGLPPWMATFADMVTLLLCFFVLLLSFAEQDAQKYRDVVGSLKDAFGAKITRTKSDKLDTTTTSSTKDKAAPASDDQQVLSGLIIKLKSIIDKEDAEFKNSSGVAADREGALLDVRSAAIFEPGSAQLTGKARTVLDAVITVLKEYPLNLVVRGHTDDQPVRSARYPTNWELSAARAANALAYIVEIGGIPVNRLKAVGYADTRPIHSNATEKGRAMNQRVEFYFHKPEKDIW